MPPVPNREDLEATSVISLSHAVEATLLTLCRWQYLQTGVEKIMINLQDGIDMQTVSIPAHNVKCQHYANSLRSIWVSTRKAQKLLLEYHL